MDVGGKGYSRLKPRLPLRGYGPSHSNVRPANMNPRDFRKAAPYLGVLLFGAIVFAIVRSLL
jgi:hypothetical protein